MLSGEPRIQLSREYILTRVGSEDIYRAFLGDFEEGIAFCNPLRGEDNPSMVIRRASDSDNLLHHDFGNDFYRGDCFHLVMQKYGCNYYEALKIVAEYFDLKKGGVTTANIMTWGKPSTGPRPLPKIQVVTRKFNKDELDWWNLYHQDIEDLKREHIYVPREIYRNHKRIPVPKTDLIFCYYYPEIEAFKLYRPLKGKKNKDTRPEDYKWDSSIRLTHTEKLDTITPASLGIIAKSRKDRLVLRKALGINSICVVQAEDPACLTDEALDHIKTSQAQLVVSDNDKKGKEFSWWLTNQHGFKHCNVPDEYREYDPPSTDFADMSRYFGLDSVTNHFKIKGLI